MEQNPKETKGTVWDETQFDTLGWSMSRVYGFIMPGRAHQFTIHFDLVLDSPLTKTSHGKFCVAPAKIVFGGTIDLNITMEHGHCSELSLVSIDRFNHRPTPNGKCTYWDYKLELTPETFISLTANSFRQELLSSPIISDEMDLDRELLF